MPTRQINSPGVEIREIDRSQISPAIVGTTVLVTGYANKGEAYNPIQVTSVTDLETNFGYPTNEAERYFYHTCKNVIVENGNLIAAKLPYDNAFDVNYKLLPIEIDLAGTGNLAQLKTDLSNISAALNDLSGSTTITEFVPITIGAVEDISLSDYDTLAAGGTYTPTASAAQFVIVNERKDKLTGYNSEEGLFITIIDPVHGMLAQRVISNTDADIMSIVTAGSIVTPFDGSLSGEYRNTSISENMMRYFPGIKHTNNGDQIEDTYNNWLTVIVSTTTVNPNSQGNLSVNVVEAWSGSIKSDAVDISTGRSTYLGDIINDSSNYIKWYAVDPADMPLNIADNECLYATPQAVDFLTFSTADADPVITVGNIVDDLETVFSKVSNLDEYQIDVVADAGLTSIAQYITDNGPTSGYYEPQSYSANDITSSTDTAVWRSVASSFDNFCKNIRKDCMAIIDGPRNLVLDADRKRVRKTAPTNTFSNTISPKLKYITGLNSSYVALYCNWLRTIDNKSGLNTWLPPSAKIAGIYVRNDRVGNIWDAPAGLNRGIISEINDISFNPTVKEADQVYIKNINYAKQNILEGFSVEGQKTTQAQMSAFDRVNVRRLFLRLERFVYQNARYFVYEPNNLFTRRRLVATIEPEFASIKTQGGLYDYRIVCDETVNTSEVIDRNELKVVILLRPVRTSEFILVDFVATRTDTNFNELV